MKYDESEIGYRDALDNFLKEVAGYEELDDLYEKACNEIGTVLKKIEKNKAEYKTDGMFLQFGYLARLITSAVMEGDRRDTAEFMNGKPMPSSYCDKLFWENQLCHMEKKLGELSSNTPINQSSSSIYF